MKTILFCAFFFIPSVMICQVTMIRILPEGGLSLPTGDFKGQNVFANNGFLGGLNVDVFFGKLGVGLFGGISNNITQYEDQLPSFSNLITSHSGRINKDSWQQLLVGLGPLYKLSLTKKIDLELSLKVGFSKFTYPDYAELIETGAPLNQQYNMYETRNGKVKDKLNLATIPALKISFKPLEKLAVTLGANYTSASGVLHSYCYLDGGFNPAMSDEQLATALRTAPMKTEVRKCNFNSIGITLGIGYTFGKAKDKQKEKNTMEPPVPNYPENNSTIRQEEADSLTLEWIKEIPNVEGANYNLWLYELGGSTRKSDSLIFKTKVNKNHQLLLPDDIKLEAGNSYWYRVQAVDDKRLKPCPEGCYSVKYTFAVGQTVRPQYYQMLSQNSGNYIETKTIVRVEIPRNIMVGGRVNGRVLNAHQEEVMTMDNILPIQKSDKYEVDEFGRMAINTRGIPAGYYVFILSNERKEKYYFRFIIPEKDESKHN